MNPQTNEPFLNWRKNDTLLDDPSRVGAQPIIVTAWNKERNSYDYNIVAYYEPMGLWYGGPGILVKTEEIKYWSEIPEPVAPEG